MLVMCINYKRISFQEFAVQFFQNSTAFKASCFVFIMIVSTKYNSHPANYLKTILSVGTDNSPYPNNAFFCVTCLSYTTSLIHKV